MDTTDSKFPSDSDGDAQGRKPLGFKGLKINEKRKLSLRGGNPVPRPLVSDDDVDDPQIVSRKGGHESLIERKIKIKQPPPQDS